MPPTQFDSFLKRVFSATGIDSQTELANILRVNRSAITQARKKESVPANWILQLFRTYSLNPDWLETGNGETYLRPGGDEELPLQACSQG